jgi:hypothetical protein
MVYLFRFGHEKIMELLTDQLTKSEEMLAEPLKAGKMAQLKRKKQKRQNELLSKLVRRRHTVTIRVRTHKTSKVSNSVNKCSCRYFWHGSMYQDKTMSI